MWRTLLLSLVASCILSVELQGQDAAALAAGDRIRLRTPALGEVAGSLESLTADALVLQIEPESLLVTVRLADVTSVERSSGYVTRSQSAWNAAKWGALVGAVPAAISLGLQHENVGENGSSVAGATALGAFSGGLFGGLIGAAIGAGRSGDRWEQVSPSLLVRPTGDGAATLGFVVSVAF